MYRGRHTEFDIQTEPYLLFAEISNDGPSIRQPGSRRLEFRRVAPRFPLESGSVTIALVPGFAAPGH